MRIRTVLKRCRISNLFLFAATTIFVSCEHNAVAPAVFHSQPSQYRHATFPLAVSNQWAYADTTFDFPTSDPLAERLIMASIDSYAGQTDHGGWNFSNIGGLQGGPNGQYSISGDTVYAYQWYNGAFINPRIAFLPPAVIVDTVTFAGPWTWSKTNVYSLGHNFVTPAGNFDSVYVYDCELSYGERYVTYLRPGIGVICAEHYGNTTQPSERSVLIAYVLTE